MYTYLRDWCSSCTTQEYPFITRGCLVLKRCGLKKLTKRSPPASFGLSCGPASPSGPFTPGTKSVRTKRSEPRRRSNRVLQKVKRHTAAFEACRPCLNHQPINSDALEGVIRNPIQQEEVVGRAFSGSVCSLPSVEFLTRGYT